MTVGTQPSAAAQEAPLRQQELQELVGAVQRLSLATTLRDVQEIVRSAARRLTGADGATFVIRDGDCCYYVDEDAISPLWKGRRFPLESCISGWAMLNRRAAAIEDIYEDDRIPHEAYRPTFVRSLLMVPIRTRDPLGAIGNYWAAAHLASEQERRLLQALADSTAVAIERIRVYAELEQRVRARTTELEATNARLAELDELRRRLVHSASHELRNALVAICWFSDSLAGRLGDNIDKEQAEQIRRSAARISAVVDDLVASADLEQEQIHLRREEVDVAALVSDSLAAYGAAADAKLVVLSASEPGPLVVDGDRVRLAQVLDNLVANAIKYTGAGGRVEVAAGVAQDDVVLRVADDGIGIGGEDKERVFDPFFRAQAARATAPGSGLGLHVSRTIVAAHGGSLTVRDTPGGGATFELRLPRRSRSSGRPRDRAPAIG